jgi:hypothetical protein
VTALTLQADKAAAAAANARIEKRRRMKPPDVRSMSESYETGMPPVSPRKLGRTLD